jgi:hypothetical protein
MKLIIDESGFVGHGRPSIMSCQWVTKGRPPLHIAFITLHKPTATLFGAWRTETPRYGLRRPTLRFLSMSCR